ncbi:MAG: endolytic transglycosylase MltG [Alphaproteobacteria bacterium]
MQKKFFKFGILLFLIFAIYFLIYVFFIPVSKSEKTIIEINQGDRLSIVADKLYNDKVINSKFLFKLWMYLTWNQNKIKIGEYEVFPSSTLNQIKSVITSGRMYNKYITIPEGLTVKQIYEILDGRDDLEGKITEFAEEGSLLPQTYAYNKTISKNDLVLKMKKAMEETIDKEWAKRDENLPLKDKKEAIILASIVEKETGLPEERGLVASVFINRLNNNWRLQSDPTVIYTLTNKYGNMMGRKLYKKDLEVDTSYNTYKIKGLPIGAIANPGLDSIKAVLHPVKSDYFYFVADGNGGHKFASTLEEHEKNRAKWKEIRDK